MICLALFSLIRNYLDINLRHDVIIKFNQVLNHKLGSSGNQALTLIITGAIKRYWRLKDNLEKLKQRT